MLFRSGLSSLFQNAEEELKTDVIVSATNEHFRGWLFQGSVVCDLIDVHLKVNEFQFQTDTGNHVALYILSKFKSQFPSPFLLHLQIPERLTAVQSSF